MSMSIEDAARGTEYQFKLVENENGEQIIEITGLHPNTDEFEVLADIKLREGISPNYIEYLQKDIVRKEEIIKYVKNEILEGDMLDYLKKSGVPRW